MHTPLFFFRFFLSIFLFFCLFFKESIAQKEISGPVFMLDALNVSQLPEHYRKADDPIDRPLSSITGLQNLPIMGGHQFSVQQFLTVLNQHPDVRAVIDLREEPHFLVNGQAVTYYVDKNWADKDLPFPQIRQNEKKLLHFLKKRKHLVVFKSTSQGTLAPVTLKVASVLTEAEFIKNLGLQYKRLYIPDHMAPSSKDVDAFIHFIHRLPPNTPIYLHCRAGQGRTTTFMALYDMMKNAKNLSFEDILNRQHELGGADLLKPAATGYKSPLEWRRLRFLKKFYNYARSNGDNFKTPWSTYNKKNSTP